MLCENCKNELKPGKKFCGVCGTPSPPEERRCNICNAKLDDGENFCPDCGAKFVKSPVSGSDSRSKSATTNIAAEAGSLVSGDSRYTLRFNKGISDEEKSIVKKLKKSPDFFLYDKVKNIIYLKHGNVTIEAFAPNNIQKPIAVYTISETISKLWNKSKCHEMFYFYNDKDAFFSWCAYIFISVYKGEIRWSASDSRDSWNLPDEKADCDITYPGTPKLEFLENGNIKTPSFNNCTEFKVQQGVFIPIA